MQKQLRELVQRKRNDRGLTQEQVANLIGCRSLEIQGFEAGLFSLRLNLLCKIVELLNIDIRDLNIALGEEAASKLKRECSELKEK